VRDIEYRFSLRHSRNREFSSRCSENYCFGKERNSLPETYNIWMSYFQIFMTGKIIYLKRFKEEERREFTNSANLFSLSRFLLVFHQEKLWAVRRIPQLYNQPHPKGNSELLVEPSFSWVWRRA